ncbi:MAG: histone deacetylase family protein [Candidatus Hermodarchaeia archaeon]|jgi:acetoin utilization protein AcuC
MIGILYREELEDYDFGEGHPFRGDRYQIFPTFLRNRLPEDENYRFLQAEPCGDEDLKTICTEDYIQFTRDYYKQAHLGAITPELQRRHHQFHSGDNRPRINPGNIEAAARLIIGQAKRGIDQIQAGEFRKIVSIGGGMHHAKPHYGEGFCIYNDVAFAAKYLIEHYGVDRVLILDTDAHAGNGTLDYFYSDPQILFIDIHQDPRTLYPGTGFADQIGEGAGKGSTINVPLPPYAGDSAYTLVFEDLILPVTTEFNPQFIIRNGGSDPHFADELTNLGLTINGFKMIGEKVNQIATTTANGKLIDLLASGYNKTILPYGWLALLSGLANFNTKIEEPVASPQNLRTETILKMTEALINELKGHLKKYWRCFQ